MSVNIHNVECQVPETPYSQSFIQQRMKGGSGGRYIDGIYRDGGIDKRHSVIADPDSFFKPSENGDVTSPTTKPSDRSRELVLAMAFGPGLTGEIGLISKYTASSRGSEGQADLCRLMDYP